MSLIDYLSNGILGKRAKRSTPEPAPALKPKPQAAKGDDDLMSSDPNCPTVPADANGTKSDGSPVKTP